MRSLGTIALALTLGATGVAAQSGDGTISGVVRDSSGAAAPGATVTVRNQASGQEQTTTTSQEGTYSVANLPAGVYTVTADLKGFGAASRRDVSLAVGAAVTVDVGLEAARRKEEITVTAMKREDTVFNTPVSVAAPSEDELRQRGVSDIEGVAATVAGFSVQNLGPGQSTVAMRGVSSGQIARDQPGVKESVGAYLDESVISLSLFTPDIDLFDVSRVEVLRGPQGTLFGSGSLSGTVRYITNQPEMNATKWFGEVTGSTIDGGNQGGSLKLGVNAPLGETAALRAAGYYTRFAGYMDAVQPDLSVNENVNTGDRVGVRAAVRIAPNDSVTITPRFVYQKVDMDGWNRIDDFNILANPFTTTRPAVTLGERELFTQIDEPYTDDFVLGDLTISYGFGDKILTSITSYTWRDLLVVRDATALTASITGGTVGLPESVYTIDAPLDDATTADGWTQELRLAGGTGRLRWLVGGFYSSAQRDYAQTLLVTGFEDATGIPTEGNFGASKDVLFFSGLTYDFDQLALFGEATFNTSDQFSLTGGLRYYDFSESRVQTFDGIFAAPGTNPGDTDANGVAPRLIATYRINDNTNLNAQVAKGFRLGGINDPLNVPLCTPADLTTFSGRDSWDDETSWNYEIGSKSRVMNGRGSFNVSAFYMDISNLQVTVTAGSCSSRLIFNVPDARSMGAEFEFAAAPTDNFDFALSLGLTDSELQSTLTSTAPDGTVSVVAGIEEGSRLPSVPAFQFAATATYQWQMRSDVLSYVSGTFQHIGSRFTQVGDEDLGTLDLLSFGANTIGAPLTASTFTYDPEMPSYDILNLRFGVVKGNWDVALFANNLTDERALLSLDRERGTRARVGYLTNQPRTFGLSARFNF
jgi:iron complex outermembrane receptor protein